MPVLEYGSTAAIPYNAERRQVTEASEIGKGNMAYLTFNKKDSVYGIPATQYEAFKNGDLHYIRASIENSIKGSQVVWLKISWDNAFFVGSGGNYGWMLTGIKIEAVVKNVDAGLTGIEIAAIILAVSFIVAVAAAAAIAAYAVYEIFTSDITTPQGASNILFAFLILGGVGIFLFFMFGGSATKSKQGIKLQGRRG